MFGLPIPIIGLLIAVFVLVFLVLRTRVHAFIAMLIAASIAGLVGGMSADETLNSITKGFGGTLGSIGIVIGLGVMMGSVLEVSGAAEKMAYSFIKMLGQKKRRMGISHYRLRSEYSNFRRFCICYPLSSSKSSRKKW